MADKCDKDFCFLYLFFPPPDFTNLKKLKPVLKQRNGRKE